MAAAVAVLVLLGSGIGWIDRTRLDAALASVAALELESRPGSADLVAGETVLFVGADLGTGPDGAARPDTVVLAYLPDDGSRVVAIPFPASLEVTRPPCERWDAASGSYLNQTVPAQTTTTLDATYEAGGPRCTVRVLQQLTGLAITRVAAVDVARLAAATAVVGDLDVCVTRPVVDAGLGPVLPAAGPGELDPQRALDFARAADVDSESDPELGRVRRHGQLVEAVLDRVLAPGTLLAPWRTGAAVEVLRGAAMTDGLTSDGLLALAATLARIEDVTSAPLPTEPELNVRGHLVLREQETTALFDAVRAGEPLPVPETDPVVAAPAPDDVRVDVLNASERGGLAARVSASLAEYGFTVGEVGNAPEPAATTVVRHSPDRSDAAALLAGTVPAAQQVSAPGTSGILQLVLGDSFDGSVQAPSATPVAEREPAPAAPVACS